MNISFNGFPTCERFQNAWQYVDLGPEAKFVSVIGGQVDNARTSWSYCCQAIMEVEAVWHISMSSEWDECRTQELWTHMTERLVSLYGPAVWEQELQIQTYHSPTVTTQILKNKETDFIN